MERLKVYYGWAKIGNVRKKRSISVMFENEIQGCRSDRGQRCLRTIQDTVFERYQTEKKGNIKTGYSQSTACSSMRNLSTGALKDAC